MEVAKLEVMEWEVEEAEAEAAMAAAAARLQRRRQKRRRFPSLLLPFPPVCVWSEHLVPLVLCRLQLADMTTRRDQEQVQD